MAALSLEKLFQLTLILLNLVTCIVSDACLMKNPCRCEFENGTGIDLSTTAPKTFVASQTFVSMATGFQMSTYSYHPCTDIPFTGNGTTDKTLPNSCTGALSVCRNRIDMKLNSTLNGTYVFENGGYEFMGNTKSVNFSEDGTKILFRNGPSNTTVLLICAEVTDSVLQVTSLEEPDDVVLSYLSKDACLKTIEVITHRSVGSTLLIIFFTMLIFYIVLGVCTKKFLMGAQGLEVVPNLAFWMDLPNLVRDGWIFAKAGFKVPARTGAGIPTSPDPNSYDSI